MSATKKKNSTKKNANTVLLGRGSFGCVTYPAPHCEKEVEKDSEQVGKVMTYGDALIEKQNYDKMETVDPGHTVFDGVPTMCPLDIHDTHNQELLQQCNMKLNRTKNSSGSNNLFVLKMAYAGTTWEQVSDPKDFWKKALRIFEGVALLQHNESDALKLVHHDIKPANIMMGKERMSLIDFGFLIDVASLKTLYRHSTYAWNWFYWNFPPEIHFLHQKRFLVFDLALVQPVLDRTISRINFFDFDLNVVGDVEDLDLDLDPRLLDAVALRRFSAAMTDYVRAILPPQSDRALMISTLRSCYADYLTTLKTYMTQPSRYEECLNKSILTFDMYSLGISCLFVLNRLTKPPLERLRALFLRMASMNLDTRPTADVVLQEYSEIVRASRPTPRRARTTKKKKIFLQN